MLGQSLEHVGCETHHAEGDAHILIVETTVQSAMSCETTMVGNDTYLLELLCFRVKEDSREVFFKPEVRPEQRRVPDAGTSSMCKECWDAQFATMLFAHAILGCDPTSRVCSIGKGLALKHISSDKHFITQDEVFLQENATQADITSAGEAAQVWLYTGAVGDTLDKLRLLRFHQKVATSKRCVQPKNLHPTSSAAKYHSLGVYIQVQLGLVHICIHRILAGKQ